MNAFSTSFLWKCNITLKDTTTNNYVYPMEKRRLTRNPGNFHGDLLILSHTWLHTFFFLDMEEIFRQRKRMPGIDSPLGQLIRRDYYQRSLISNRFRMRSPYLMSSNETGMSPTAMKPSTEFPHPRPS